LSAPSPQPDSAQTIIFAKTSHSTYYSGSSSVIEASELETLIILPDIPSRHYCLKRPMKVLIERDGRGFTVSQPDTAAFSYDADLSTALDLFYEALTSQYEFLKRNKPNLSSSLQRDLETFETLLQSC